MRRASALLAVAFLSVSGCAGAEDSKTETTGTQGTTLSVGGTTIPGTVVPATTAVPTTNPAETTTSIVPWPRITTTTKLPPPPTVSAPKPPTTPKPTTTVKPVAPGPTLKPISPTCGAVQVFGLVYLAATWIQPGDPKIPQAISSLEQAAADAGKAVPSLTGALKELVDYQKARFSGTNPDPKQIEPASKVVADWTNANCR